MSSPLQMIREIRVLHLKHNRPLPLKIVLSYEDFWELLCQLTDVYRTTGKAMKVNEAEVYGMRITNPDGEFDE